MASFGGMVLTNRGRNLQAKAQAGIQLNFTRIAVGDGNLGGSSIVDLNALIHQVKSLNITKLKTMTGGKAVVGAILSNQDITSGFYFREIGVFAQDPDVGEILYCYANCGATAEYIPAGGGPDIIEKSFDIITIIGNASNVTATIDSSLIYASAQDLNNHENNSSIHVKKDGTLQTGLNAEKVGGKSVSELAPASHTHTKANITDFAHTHNINEVTSLLGSDGLINPALMPNPKANLVLNSDFRFGLGFFRKNTSRIWDLSICGEQSMTYLGCGSQTMMTVWEYYHTPYIFIPDYLRGVEKVSFSSEMYAFDVTEGAIYTELCFFDENKKWISTSSINAQNGVGWKRYKKENITIPTNAVYMILGCAGQIKGYGAYRRLKINRGEIAYPYSTEADDRFLADLANSKVMIRYNKDSNGIFRTVEYKRLNNSQYGTVFCKSELSGGTSPQYTTKTERYYDLTGHEIHVITKTLVYDSDGDLTQELINL